MFVRVLILALLLLIAPAGAQVPGLEDAITDGVPFQLDEAAVAQRVANVADAIGGVAVHDCVRDITSDPTAYRMMGTPTQDMFVERHKDVFADLGLASDLQQFEKGGPGLGMATVLGEGGTNIVAVLPGADPTKWVVIGGHYDTREGSIGALDNGSGICTVKEIARALKADVDANGLYEASVIFNWYDGEEWGLYGSIAFAEDPSVAKQLLGLAPDAAVTVLVSQSYDMPGVNYPAKNNWVQYGDATDTEALAVLNLRTAPIHGDEPWTCWSYGCYEELKTRADFHWILLNNTNYQFLVREVAYDLLQYPPELVWISDDDYGRSDHIPLIARGAAGMRIQGSHDEEYPCYHQPCDTLDWLYLQTGGEALLKQAYDAEASIGGTVAMYAALKGNVGAYGLAYLADQNSGLLGLVDTASVAAPVADAKAPGMPMMLAVAALALGLLARRR